MTAPRTLALIALLSAATVAAHGNAIQASAPTAIFLGPSADTLSLAAVSTAMAPVFTQGGTFVIGDSGSLQGTFAFSLVDNVTVNGVTRAVTLLGQDQVALDSDTLSIFASGPIPIGDATWSLRPFTITGYNLQPYSMALTADVTPSVTPEPAGLLLLGTGAFATALSIRRRLFAL